MVELSSGYLTAYWGYGNSPTRMMVTIHPDRTFSVEKGVNGIGIENIPVRHHSNGIVSITSAEFPNVHLRLDGNYVTGPMDSGGGYVNSKYGSGDLTRFRLQHNDDGTISLASVQYPNVYLRLDGNGVSETTDNGGTVNCQFGVGPYEKFRLEHNDDRTVSIASVQFPNIYLRLSARHVTETSNESGGGTVNCQFGIGQFTKFYITGVGADCCEQITSRSSLTQDFDIDTATKQLKSKPVYRTSISVCPMTSLVDVWASEEVTVEINGSTYTIDPIKSAKVQPSILSKLSVSIPASDVNCPHLILCTDLMMPDHKHYIFPDVEAHQKIMNLQAGDLHRSRSQLGISDQYSEEGLNQLQTVLQSIAKTIQYTHNPSAQGVHHDRILYPGNLDHPHFLLDFTEDRSQYKPLVHSEVPQYIEGARLLQENVGQSLLGDLGDYFKKATIVVVHTVEKVGQDTLKVVENVVRDDFQTVLKVGEDIVHGDITHIGQDLLQGGENINKDLVKGAGTIGGDIVAGAGQLVAGAGQLLVMTLHTAEEVVQFVLTHTGPVGKVLGWLFQKIGVAIEKIIDWLLEKIDWSIVLHTHDVLIDLFNRKLDEMTAFPQVLKQRSDRFFTDLTDKISHDIDQAIKQLDVEGLSKRPEPVLGHSNAVESVEWLLNKFTYHAADAGTLTFPPVPESHNSLVDNLFDQVEQLLGRDGEIVITAIEQSIGDIKGIFTNPKHETEYLLKAVLEISKAVSVLCLDAVKVILDVLLDLLTEMLKGFKKMMNDPWRIPFITDLYGHITEGREMSFLSGTCFLLAIPTAIISKSAFNTPPFQSQLIGSSLAPLSEKARSIGIVYSACHIYLTPLAIITDILTAIGAAKAAKEPSLGVKKMLETGNLWIRFGPDGPYHYYPEPSAEADPTSSALTTLNLAVGFVAQMLACPIPPDEPYLLPFDHAKGDVFEAPSYFSHVVWLYQWGGWGFNLVASMALNLAVFKGITEKTNKYIGTAIASFNAVYGIVHMGLMATIDAADRQKRAALLAKDQSIYNPNLTALQLFQELEASATELYGHQPYWSFSETQLETKVGRVTLSVDQWAANIRNYFEWAKDVSPGQGIPDKGFGNIMDTFPEIGQLGVVFPILEGTAGWSMLGTGLFDTLGHLGEGITYLVRTKRHGLL